MLKGELKFVFEPDEDGNMLVNAGVHLAFEGGPQERLYDITQLVYMVLQAVEVNNSVEAVMIAEAIQQNDWWDDKKLPYAYPASRDEAIMIFSLMRALDDEAMMELKGIFDAKKKKKEQ